MSAATWDPTGGSVETGRTLADAAEWAQAQAVRIASLEEEIALAKERARSEGDELEVVRRELRAKEIAQKDVIAGEKLARAELHRVTATAQDLEGLVASLREELRAKELELLTEKEAKALLGERAAAYQRELGDATTRLAAASAAEQAAKEAAAAAEDARTLAMADAERARRDATAALDSRATVARDAAAAGERTTAELTAQLHAAQELARSQAGKLATLQETQRAHSAELESRNERCVSNRDHLPRSHVRLYG